MVIRMVKINEVTLFVTFSQTRFLRSARRDGRRIKLKSDDYLRPVL